MAKLSELIKIIEKIAPPGLAADWDNSGLQVGNPDSDVSSVLVALDPLPEVMREAAALGCGLVLAHHPLFFRPVKSLDTGYGQGNAVAVAVRANVAIYSAHTSFDRAVDGVSDALAKKIGLMKLSVLEQAEGWPKGRGYGKLGVLPKAMSAGRYAKSLKKALGLSSVRLIGEPGKKVGKVAVCGGSGSDMAIAAACAGADCYVTGDIKYHEALDALDTGMAVIDVGHFGSELPSVARMAELLKKALKRNKLKVEVRQSLVQAEPWSTL